MDKLISYAMQFVGIPYKWGGSNPLEGFDCSGYVQHILRFAGEDPPGDQTAQTLYDHFEKNGQVGLCGAGSIAFYGKSVKEVTHVAFCIDPYRMIEAGGGGKLTLTREDAARQNAFVRGSLIRSRQDLLITIKPYYAKIGLKP